jgi:hypothetical protein
MVSICGGMDSLTVASILRASLQEGEDKGPQEHFQGMLDRGG